MHIDHSEQQARQNPLFRMPLVFGWSKHVPGINRKEDDMRAETHQIQRKSPQAVEIESLEYQNAVLRAKLKQANDEIHRMAKLLEQQLRDFPFNSESE